MGIVSKPRIFKKNQVNIIKQNVIHISNDEIMVVSANDKKYPVTLSDRVRLTMNVEIGDTAIIKTFPTGWLVVDIIKKEVEAVLSPAEDELELQRQQKELDDIGYGNY